MPYGQPLFPLNFAIPASEIMQALENEPNENRPVVGLCFKSEPSSNEHYNLSVWKVIWGGEDPYRDTTLRVALARTLTTDRDYFDFNQSSERILHTHFDHNTPLNPVSIIPPLIEEFERVFVDKNTLMYYCNPNNFNSGNIYVSRAVTNFFEGDNNWKNYRTLKFAPHPFPVPAVRFDNQDSTAYYLAPSCPPIWKYMMALVGVKKFDKPSDKFDFFQIPIYSHELIAAFEKAGEKTTPVAPNNGIGIEGFRKFTSRTISRLKEMMFFYRNQ